MFDIALTKKMIVSTANRSGLYIAKHSPTILVGVGVVGAVVSTVMACRATLKLDAVLEESNETLEKIKKAKETIPPDKYSDDDYKHDLVVAYAQRGLGLAKLYAPAAITGAASVACLIGSHTILSKRNVALTAAYKIVDSSFKKYREKVVSEFGEDKDRAFRYDLTEEILTETSTDETGKKVKTKKSEKSFAHNGVNYSEYAKFFDEVSPMWRKDPTYNNFFLVSQQNYANDLLRARGHVFLNEVYDMLGIPRTPAGAVVGWVRDNDTGDNHIDFGIFEARNPSARDFVNGYNKSILLDFNVDGVIYDLI